MKVLELVHVGDSCSSPVAAETWSLEDIGMERASMAVSGALFVSSWLGL